MFPLHPERVPNGGVAGKLRDNPKFEEVPNPAPRKTTEGGVRDGEAGQVGGVSDGEAES